MKILSLITTIVVFLFSGHAFAGEVGMHLAGGATVNGTLQQQEHSANAEFTGTSENSQDLYKKTKSTLEKSFAGFVDAVLIDHQTGEEIDIVLAIDDVEGSTIVALAKEKVLFVWLPVAN